jgi:hypothetical protein
MFARTQTLPVREAASLNGLATEWSCFGLLGTAAIAIPAYRQESTIKPVSKRFAHQMGLSFGLGSDVALAGNLGTPEDRT